MVTAKRPAFAKSSSARSMPYHASNGGALREGLHVIDATRNTMQHATRAGATCDAHTCSVQRATMQHATRADATHNAFRCDA
jgi:hypothetical protein